MLYLILLLISLGIIAAVAEAIRQWWLRQKVKKGELAEIPAIQENAAAGCCGLHETCESESLLAGVSKAIEYYEDEDGCIVFGGEQPDPQVWLDYLSELERDAARWGVLT